MPRKVDNIGILHGRWGEAVAAEYLRRNGYNVIDCNSHPVGSDARLEIDIVAFDRSAEVLAFVEVKQHSRFSPYAKRLRSIDKRKLNNLCIACRAWLRKYKWQKAFRFDVMEIYGRPGGGSPVIDYIRQVELFPKKGRFVKWSD